MARVVLKSSHLKPIVAGHPWVFAQAVDRLEGSPTSGDEVRVESPDGSFLGHGFWSNRSAISVRLLTRKVDETIDGDLFERRLRAAHTARTLFGLPSTETSGYRLVHAEGDGLPGLVVDVYGDVLVLQLLTEGIYRRRAVLAERLCALLSPKAIVAFASGDARSEGPAGAEWLAGTPIGALSFSENGLEWAVPQDGGQKTGYFFDQREPRRLLEGLAAGRDVLDMCCYVGGFSLAAARGGARQVSAYDSSRGALEVGQAMAHKHGFTQVSFQRADMRTKLAELSRQGEHFDLVVFDPPKLVPTVKHLEKGRRMYRRLNAHAMSLVRTGGLLVTCSCSAAMAETDLLRTLALAASDAGRSLTVFRVAKQGPDHPLSPSFPEGSYLKSVFARVD